MFFFSVFRLLLEMSEETIHFKLSSKSDAQMKKICFTLLFYLLLHTLDNNVSS